MVREEELFKKSLEELREMAQKMFGVGLPTFIRKADAVREVCALVRNSAARATREDSEGVTIGEPEKVAVLGDMEAVRAILDLAAKGLHRVSKQQLTWAAVEVGLDTPDDYTKPELVEAINGRMG